MYDKLFAICLGFNRRFPDGYNPYQMMTRLLEESGELAKEVSHFEGSGIKNEKYVPPDKNNLTKEIRQTVCCALQAGIYYQAESELEANIEACYQRLKAEGWIE